MHILASLKNIFRNICDGFGRRISEIPMATNKNRHDGHLVGPIKGRSQFQTPSGKWAKRDTSTGQIVNVKADPKPFKGVRKEK
jgi:hypothetical protein